MIQARPDRPREPLILLLLTAFGFWFFSETVADPDLWGHIRFGQDILRAGSIPRADPYSYQTSGQTWINHEWLAEVLFAGLYDQTGPTGLIVFKAAVGVLILIVTYVHMRRRGLGVLRSAVLLALLCVPLRMGLGTIRPQLFTYGFFLLLLLLMARATWGREHRLWLAPAVLAVWTNLHGGVLAGIGILTLWGLARLVRSFVGDHRALAGRGRGVTTVILLLTIGCLALLINPYGAVLPVFLLRTATVARPEIMEWMPLAIVSLPGLTYLCLLALGAFALAGSRLRREPEVVLIVGVTAILPIISGRHFPLFALALLVLTAEHIADAWDRTWPSLPVPHRRGPWASALLVSAALLLVALSLPRFACIRLDPNHFKFPARVVAVLKQSDVGGNLAVPFTWGEYVLWHLGPRVKVSIDGRRETVYSDRAYQQSLDFERGRGEWDSLLKTAPTDLVLTANASPTANLLDRTSGWSLIYVDRVSRLYVREGSPLTGSITSRPIPAVPDDGGGLCFPPPTRPRRRDGA